MRNIKKLNFEKIGCLETGYITALEEHKNIPFSIKRVYYSYLVPGDIQRGRHAHKTLEQVLICLCGSITVSVTDGQLTDTFILDDPAEGLYIGPYIWRDMYDYRNNAVLMVLASDYYDENDYVRNYGEFIRLINHNKEEFVDGGHGSG